MRIIAFGDIHMDYENAASIPGIKEADLVIVTGDFTNFGGREEAEKVLNGLSKLNKNILALMGNLDHPSVHDFLIEKGISLHGKGVKMGEAGIFGVGGSNITPFDTPTEFSEDELKKIVEQAHSEVADQPVKILVSHTPPLNTATDKISAGVNVGSSAIREFIEKEQPDFCLTGHIHEAKSTDKIGKTLILNPGMLSEGGWIEVYQEAPGKWKAELH